MKKTTENPDNNFLFLSYNAEGKQAKFDYSNVQISGKSICQYKPNNFLNGQENLFTPFISFRIMLQFILLDKKGRIKFLNENELFQVIFYLNNIDYSVGTFGPYFFLTIHKKTN